MLRYAVAIWLQQGAEPFQKDEFRSGRGVFEEALCHLVGPWSAPCGESAQQGLKIVHGDGPAENVLRFRDSEWRVPFLEGLRSQDLIQLRKWRQLKCSHRCVEASTTLAEESDLASGRL